MDEAADDCVVTEPAAGFRLPGFEGTKPALGDNPGLVHQLAVALQDQIGHSDKTVTDSNRNFLAFTHKPGHEKLAYQFSLALKAFKQTPEYQALLTRYGL